MKFLKNLTLISLLLGACISSAAQPTALHPGTYTLPALYPGTYTLDWATALFFNKHACAAILAAEIAVFYVPYTLFTRHKTAENFIKHQKDIESYSIAIQIQQSRNKTPLEESFTDSDYKMVIKKTLEWAKLHNAPHFKTTFKPSIKLVKNKKTYTLRSIKRGNLPEYSTKKSAYLKQLKRLLTGRFELPYTENETHATRIKQGILSGFMWTAVSVLIGIPFIPLATLSIPFLAFSQHSSAKNFVENPENIESYSITVKVRHLCKTIQEQSFTSPDPKLVTTQALHYAQQAQSHLDRLFFEPSIKLVDSKETYSLRRITKQKLPKETMQLDSYWQKVESKLADRLIVPTTTVMSTPYQGRLAFFGTSMALWIIFPFAILV